MGLRRGKNDGGGFIDEHWRCGARVEERSNFEALGRKARSCLLGAGSRSAQETGQERCRREEEEGKKPLSFRYFYFG